jgi:hypothetical protein
MDLNPCPNVTGTLHYQKGLHSGNAADISENYHHEKYYADAIGRFTAYVNSDNKNPAASLYHN